MLIGALINATSVAKELIMLRRDVTLLCAGTQGHDSMEDVIGAGAVLDAMLALAPLKFTSDAARMALALFRSSRSCLRETLSDTMSGGNLRAAKLEKDIEFCADLDSIPIVGMVRDDPLRVLKISTSPVTPGNGWSEAPLFAK